MKIISYSPPDVMIDEENRNKLEQELQDNQIDIVCAGQLFRYWSNGQVKKHLYFEHNQGIFDSSYYPAPNEPSPFAKDRWNPFNGFILTTKSTAAKLNLATSSPHNILSQAITTGLKIKICPDIIAHKKSSLSIYDWFQPIQIIKKNRFIRDKILSVKIAINHLQQYIKEKNTLGNYLKEIEAIKEKKEIILSFDFGGLGDCLVYSSLPGLLFKKYGVNFYLDESVRKIFRHQDIADICFEKNPYFKGYKNTEKPFRFRQLLSGLSWKEILTEQGRPCASYQLEKQFDILECGLPEIAYKPKKLPNYEKILLCDKNWFSGQKWGLYNDPTHLKREINNWTKQGEQYQVEFIEPQNQDIYTYVDKIYSAGKFVCYFSGGNNVAAALNIPATVIVPENLDGISLSMFLYTNSNINYVRTRSLESYL